MRSKNFILFFLVCLCALGVFYFGKMDLKEKISLEVLDLFPQNQERKMVDLYRKIGDSKVIFVAQNADDEIAKQEFDAFLSQVSALPNVQSIIRNPSENEKLKNFISENYFWVGNFNPPKISIESMVEKISKDALEEKLNPLDPLGMITIPSYKKDFKIHNLPYVIIQMKDSNAQAVDDLYHEFKALAEQYKIKHYFSPLFLSVQNPQLVMQEVNVLTSIAFVFFILLYFVILRMPFLTFNSIATILLSNLVAIMVLIAIYPKVSIMSLSFGIGISNICIDYMMHHHFLGYYLKSKIAFNASVFYGYITTMLGFLVCLFVPFPLLNQLALYAMINLSVAYLCFSFLYQNITFSKPRYFSFVSKMHYPKISAFLFVGFALVLGGYGIWHTQEDLDLSKLDYQNKTMNMQKDFFAPLFEEKTFLIRAKSADSLIMQAKEIAKIDSDSVGILGLFSTKKEIKTRERYFKSFAFLEEKNKLKNALYRISKEDIALAQMLKGAYIRFPKTFTSLSIQDLEVFGVDLIQEKGYYYFQGTTSKLAEIAQIDGIYTQQLQDLISQITSSIYAPMVSILILAFITILLLLIFVAKRGFFDALSFVLLPPACVLFYLALSHTPLNMMHLFALLLVVVVGVDYGIYHIQEENNLEAKHAVLFSTLTTLCSFGLFLFSQTKALSSFGEVVVIGMGCILLMIFFQKDFKGKYS